MSSIDTKDKKTPDLEAIAKQYALFEERAQFDQLSASIESTISSMKFSDGGTFEYMKDGEKKYKTRLSDNEKTELAEKIIGTFVYHTYIRLYGAKPNNFDDLMKLKNKVTGEYFSESVLREQFGIDKRWLVDKLKGMNIITPSSLSGYLSKLIEQKAQKMIGTILAPLDSIQPGKIKEFLKGTASKYMAGPDLEKYSEKLEKAYLPDEIVSLYGELASHYPKKNKKAA